MKLKGIFGKGTGKLGSSVFAISGGQQIVRQYQPTVANPSTDSQVDKRSAFKLLSQLSASVKPSIAIRKKGLVSPRNQFMSENYGSVSVSGGNAMINLNSVQLTKSNRAMANFTADRSSGTKIAVELTDNMAGVLDKVVYAAFTKMADGSLMPAGSIVVEAAGVDGHFAGELPYESDACVIYCYGIIVTNAAATTAFGNMMALTAENVAKLFATSSEAAAGMTMTKTKGLTLGEGVNTATSTDDAPSEVTSITAAYLDGSSWDLPETPNASQVSIGGTVVTSRDAVKAGQYNGLTIPAVGSQVTVAKSADVQNGSITINFDITESTFSWLVIYDAADTAAQKTVLAVWPNSVTKSSGGGDGGLTTD